MLSEFDIPDYPEPVPSPAVPPALVEAYVLESALEFFKTDDLPDLLGLSPEQTNILRSDPAIAERVLTTARELRASGDAFRKASSRYAEALLPDVAALVTDPEAKAGERLRAAELLATWGGHAPKNTPQVAVQVNLQSLVGEATERKAAVLADRSYLEVQDGD